MSHSLSLVIIRLFVLICIVKTQSFYTYLGTYIDGVNHSVEKTNEFRSIL